MGPKFRSAHLCGALAAVVFVLAAPTSAQCVLDDVQPQLARESSQIITKSRLRVLLLKQHGYPPTVGAQVPLAIESALAGLDRSVNELSDLVTYRMTLQAGPERMRFDGYLMKRLGAFGTQMTQEAALLRQILKRDWDWPPLRDATESAADAFFRVSPLVAPCVQQAAGQAQSENRPPWQR